MGRQFEYDESGSTSYFFVLSFLTLYLVPTTITKIYGLFCGSKDQEDTTAQDGPAVVRKKHVAKNSGQGWCRASNVIFVCAWVLFLVLAYAVSDDEVEKQYNPFEILELSADATDREIKKRYRELSLKFHPDRNQDDPEAADHFVRIAKAYEALTDEVTRKNWEQYGNPDGPQERSFGIALPAWLVSEDNKHAVLLLYVLGLLIIVPTVVVMIWRRSQQFVKNKILHKTIAYFFRFMENRKIIEVMAVADEFRERRITLRSTDLETVREVCKNANLGSDPFSKGKKRWRFNNVAHAVATRVLFHAHMERMPVTSEMQADQVVVLELVPMLTQALVEACFVNYRFWLSTAKECMYTCQLLMQARPEAALREPFAMVEEQLNRKAITTLARNKPQPITNLRELFAHSEDELRAMLQPTLGDEAMEDLLIIGSRLPFVTVELTLEDAMGQTYQLDQGDTVYAGEAMQLKFKLVRHDAQSFPESDEGYRLRGLVKPTHEAESEDAEPEAESAEAVVDDEDEDEDEDDVWGAIEKPDKEEGSKELKSRPALCPHYPHAKDEQWWVFVGTEKDKAKHEDHLDSLPLKVMMKDDFEGKFAFGVPRLKGGHVWYPSFYLVSDSYIGLDLEIPMKFKIATSRPVVEEVAEAPAASMSADESKAPVTNDSDSQASDSEDDEEEEGDIPMTLEGILAAARNQQRDDADDILQDDMDW
ncbi:uncharacterized protein MONBRDRAFT_30812 [Monosiga brevicollis MX1]|uniref:J domain-containing protein n=1 Tax=Monosiga brevicollis TaxID=81824 RepID=A9UPF4_MONBE|nr:uncharacterized protein MONBRDRAFT_30812 [Monosiga brevicollis MX1]EDQ92863.1 predicted protein [Monosiga brevicollis MX1]|eukprot:XP_001742625.1 hypothetical protein [Monosiga brevicollis MX1]